MRMLDERDDFGAGITLGDNFLPAGLDSPTNRRWKSQWEDLYGPMEVPFFASLGNHDYFSFASPLAAMRYGQLSASWNLPAPNYSISKRMVSL